MAIDRNPNLKPIKVESSRHGLRCWWAGKPLGAKINPRSAREPRRTRTRRARTARDPRRAPPLDQGTLGSPTGEVRGVSPRVREIPNPALPRALRHQGIPDIGFSRCRLVGIGARSRGDAGAEPRRAVAHTPRSCVSTLCSPRARSATARVRPPATSPARTPLTNLVFPHSQAAPSGAALLGDDGGQAEDLVLLRPRCGQLLLRAGSPDEAPPRAHDA